MRPLLHFAIATTTPGMEPSTFKSTLRVVHRYCYDVKPFNLMACFIMKCDTNVMITCFTMVGHGQQCTIMYKL